MGVELCVLYVLSLLHVQTTMLKERPPYNCNGSDTFLDSEVRKVYKMGIELCVAHVLPLCNSSNDYAHRTTTLQSTVTAETPLSDSEIRNEQAPSHKMGLTNRLIFT